MRDFLAFCTLMACLVVLVASLIALVRPIPQIGMPNRKRALYGVGVAFGLFILTAIVIPAPKNGSEKALPKESTEKAQAKNDSAPTVPKPEKQEPTLAFTPDQFAARFNALALAADKPWRISEFSAEKGSIKYMLSDHLGFVGSVGDSARVQSMMVLGTGDGTLGSGVDVFMVLGMAYCAAAETSDLKQCGEPVLKLMKGFKEGGEPTKTIVNNIEFSFTRNNVMGSVMSISPVS